MAKRKRSIPVFYIVLAVCVLLFLIGLNFGLKTLNAWLEDYESSLPKHKAEEVFSSLYDPDNVAGLLEKSGMALSRYENAEAAKEVLSRVIGGEKLTWSGVRSGVDEVKKYAVRAGQTPLSTFTLKKSGEKTPFGNDLYELGDVTLALSSSEEADILVPDGYRLTINGIDADPALIEGDPVKTDSCSHMPEGVKGVTYSLWHVGGLLKTPELRVFSPDGRECPVAEDAEAGCPRAGLVYDEALREEMSSYVIEAAETYAAFMQMDAYRSKVLSYFEAGTPLYDSVSTVEYYFVIDHNGDHFENVSCGEFYRYDENTFSCRVSFVQVLTLTGAPDYRDFLDMTLYLRKVNGVYLIYDRMNHN